MVETTRLDHGILDRRLTDALIFLLDFVFLSVGGARGVELLLTCLGRLLVQLSRMLALLFNDNFLALGRFKPHVWLDFVLLEVCLAQGVEVPPREL